MNDPDGIGEFYRQKVLAREEAWQLVREARARDASSEEINRLYEAALDAGYTGD
jgi:hypothetical protein